jgi:hypothetical protein
MAFSSLRICAVSCAAASWLVSAAFAQASTNYTSVEATSEKPMQLSYHASVQKDCSPAPLPTVRVITAPKAGTLTVRPGQLTTSKVVRCGRVKTPVQLVFYQARAGYAGLDEVKYEVTSADGQVATYEVTITVKELPAQTKPGERASRPL